MRIVAVIVPLYNDASCVAPFLNQLSRAKRANENFDVYLIDDGSTESLEVAPASIPENLSSVRIVRLACNLGHQRAISVGLVELVTHQFFDYAIVIDGDGEDDPLDAATLLDALSSNPGSIVVAKRSRRQEGFGFRAAYITFKLMFRSLTGADMDFGNFSALSRRNVERVVSMDSSWNHFAGSLLKSRVPLHKVSIDRSRRYVGQSKMNLESLVTHGLSAVSLFLDAALTRILVFFSLLAAFLLTLVMSGVALRLVAGVPIPGWAALGATLAGVGIFLVLFSIVTLSFVVLSSRSTLSTAPINFALNFVKDVERIK